MDFPSNVDERRLRLLESRLSNSQDAIQTEKAKKEESKSPGPRTSPRIAATPPTKNKSRRGAKFTTEEDKLLTEAYKIHPDDWEAIATFCAIDRTPKQLKSRFSRRKTPPVSILPEKKKQKTTKSATPATSTGPEIVSESPDDLLLEIKTLKAQLNEKDETIESLTQKNERQEKEVAGLQEKVKKMIADQSNHNKQSKESQNYDQWIETLVRENAEAEYQLRRLQVWENSARLGKLKRPIHTLTGEEWENGTSFQELEIRQQNLRIKKEKIENKRKEVAKTKNAIKPKLNDCASPALSAEYQQLLLSDEVLRNQLLFIKYEENEIGTCVCQLEFEKNLHRKTCKLLFDQEKSHFNSRPLLHNRYVLKNLLGCGGFSEVYEAFDIKQLRTVACKIHQLDSSWSKQKKDNYQKHAEREYAILKTLSSLRVVGLYDIFILDDTCFCTIIEFCSDGDLDSRLKERNKLPERETRAIMGQIIEGLRYLHHRPKPIIHFDLKPGNILFHKGEVKITDFGLSKIVEDSNDGMVDLTSQGAGTHAYLPPECYAGMYSQTTVSISSKVDIWSLGIVCYQMIFGKRPFDTGRSNTIEFPGKISAECKHFITQCLTPDHLMRPDIAQIAALPFVANNKK